MTWWLWLLLGIVLLAIELLTPGGFWVLFFGVGAVATGFLAALGIAASEAAQWVLFSTLSIAALLTFRRPLLRKFTANPPPAGDIDRLAGEIAVALSMIGPNEVGKAELRGTPWAARNVGAAPVATGQRCKVEHVDGLMLWIRGS
jgi:inner membrane protein